MSKGSGGFMNRVLSEYEKLCEKLTGVQFSEPETQRDIGKERLPGSALPKATYKPTRQTQMAPSSAGGMGELVRLIRELLNK